ncbi:MAG: hypothetical protein MUE41_14560, partial [Gemmatimonadaceae bacterium]|nr:hypothetical protein [Gemmatimonadaceae bacterium]
MRLPSFAESSMRAWFVRRGVLALSPRALALAACLLAPSVPASAQARPDEAVAAIIDAGDLAATRALLGDAWSGRDGWPWGRRDDDWRRGRRDDDWRRGGRDDDWRRQREWERRDWDR